MATGNLKSSCRQQGKHCAFYLTMWAGDHLAFSLIAFEGISRLPRTDPFGPIGRSSKMGKFLMWICFEIYHIGWLPCEPLIYVNWWMIRGFCSATCLFKPSSGLLWLILGSPYSLGLVGGSSWFTILGKTPPTWNHQLFRRKYMSNFGTVAWFVVDWLVCCWWLVNGYYKNTLRKSWIVKNTCISCMRKYCLFRVSHHSMSWLSPSHTISNSIGCPNGSPTNPLVMILVSPVHKNSQP